MAKIEVQNLYKVFGSHPEKVFPLIEKGMSKDEIHNKTGNTIGVNGVDFKVNKGEFFVVMGLSGSGKSTLIRCLNRLIEPTKGKVLIDGEDILKANKEKLIEIRRSKLSMVFQNFGLFPHRTVASNVEYGLEVQDIDPKQRKEQAYESLELVGLKGYEESMPDELSGGMQQRVGLARALANDPDILLMDEAFSALDPLIRKEMQDELLDLQSKMHKTIVFITHDLDEALKLGDRIAIMKDGEVVQIGTAEDILTNPANDYVRDFVQDVDRSKVIRAESIMKKPIETITTEAGTRLAARKMKTAGISSIFITTKDKKLKGLLRIEDAAELIQKNIHNFEDVIITDIPKVSPDTPILDIMPMIAGIDYPIAVVDENDKLLGIIVKVSLITGIVGEVD